MATSVSENLDPLSMFQLSNESLRIIEHHFTDAVRSGLSKWLDGPGVVKALPSSLVHQDADVSGMAIALDTGGTRLRGAIVHLGSESGCLPAAPLEEPLPTGREGAVTAEQFYAAHVRLVERLVAEVGCSRETPIGWVFSYPAESTLDGDARLLAWTKDLEISGMVGTLVGASLRAALTAAGFRTARLRVLNDTVSTLLAGVAVFGRRFERYLGLVVGTGTNMAVALPRGQVPKLRDSGPNDEVICINLESGNFDPGYLSEQDEQLDRTSTNPGSQRFEKAVAGHYLPAITEGLVQSGVARDVAQQAVLQRSAQLVAAGIRAVRNASLGTGSVGIVVNGSLFWAAEGYSAQVEGLLQDAHPTELAERCTILRVANDNLIGAAYSVLAPK